MSALFLDRRDDGSVSLFIDGDLQFDSRDEAVYHECLALPALALAERRCPTDLRALICGGGDGLVARELLKSPHLTAVDLVDYDPDVVGLARSALTPWNGASLADGRLTAHITDAWAFTADAVAADRHYGLIVADFTLPQDQVGATLHSVDWYERLAHLLTLDGVLAVNAASPSATPEAYWSIYNAMRTAGLHVRPYRIALPSFEAEGYGPDWGFLLASPTPIPATAFADDLMFASPRLALQDAAQLRRLAVFPLAVADVRATAIPARASSDLLLRYLGLRRDGLAVAAFPLAAGTAWDGFAQATDPIAVPPADVGQGFLPAAISAAIAAGPAGSGDGDTLLARVLTLMPALQPHQTRTMVESLMQDPGRFLGAIDLDDLVERLLSRAAELPQRIVEELRHLKSRLHEVLADGTVLLRLGMRVVTVLVVVVIVANLIYPDAAYGKGGGHVSSTSGFSHSAQVSPTGAAAPVMARGSGFRSHFTGRRQTIDESGFVYPARNYRYHRTLWPFYSHSQGTGHSTHPADGTASDVAAEIGSFYRLSPETDVLDDGRLAMTLTDRTFLLIDDELVHVVDRTTGRDVFALLRQDTLIFRLSQELARQRTGLVQTINAKKAWNAWVSWLSFVPWYSGDTLEVQNLQETLAKLSTAQIGLGIVPPAAPSPPKPPVPGAHELFTSVWLLPDGSGVVAELPDHALGLLTPTSWGPLSGNSQPVSGPYPTGFRNALADVLGTLVKDADGTTKGLTQAQMETMKAIQALEADKRDYTQLQRSGMSEVDYGTTEIPVDEALRRTERDLAQSKQDLSRIETRMVQWPAEVTTARYMLAHFQQGH
ncbi:MAG: hypothetical protein H7338_24930 [Candidatus Sericytochromatia bacterium]|nr:hypothetical protein [Candidatus Sericytochromatia bacterium]